MEIRMTWSLAALGLALACQVALADFVSFAPSLANYRRSVTTAEAATGAPAGGDVYQFRVSTDADIVSIDKVRVLGADHRPLAVGLYQSPFGDPENTEPGNPALIPTFPALGVDSWVTTPGPTMRVGPNLPGSPSTSFSDSTDDGPQTDFQFAQLTLPAGPWFELRGRVTIKSTQNPGSTYTAPFYFDGFGFGPGHDIPEPTSFAMGGLSLLVVVKAARRW